MDTPPMSAPTAEWDAAGALRDLATLTLRALSESPAASPTAAQDALRLVGTLVWADETRVAIWPIEGASFEIVWTAPEMSAGGTTLHTTAVRQTYALPLSAAATEPSAEGAPHATLSLFWRDAAQAAANAALADDRVPTIAPALGAVIAAHSAARPPRPTGERATAPETASLHRGDGDGDDAIWARMLDAVTDPICILTPDYRILRANAAYMRLFAADPAHLAGHACHLVAHGSLTPCEECPLPRTLATGLPAVGHRLLLLPDTQAGTLKRRLFETRTYPVRDAGGTLVRIVEVLADVTGREQLRHARDEMRALREADRLKEELIGTVGHELRTPLTAILGYAATLRRHEQRLPAAERREYLDAIVSSGERLSAIVDRLLDLSRLTRQTAALDRTPVALDRLARDALAGAERADRRDSGRHTFALRVVDADGRPTDRHDAVPGDARALRDVLDNLLDNAVKFSPGGGEVAIAVRPPDADALARIHTRLPSATTAVPATRARASSGGDYVEVIVRDGGIGIPEEQLGHVFDPFHRVDTRLTRETGGLGLGLALSRRIVELHRGAIWAENDASGGSAIHVLLPLAASGEGQADDPDAETVGVSPGHGVH